MWGCPPRTPSLSQDPPACAYTSPAWPPACFSSVPCTQHTHAHARTQKHTHAHTTNMHTQVHAHAHATQHMQCTHKHTHTCAHIQHMHMHKRMHTQCTPGTNTHAHTQTHTYTHKHMHMCTQNGAMEGGRQWALSLLGSQFSRKFPLSPPRAARASTAGVLSALPRCSHSTQRPGDTQGHG